MYPKVFLDYMRNHLDYGRVSVLPTPLFFYGMEPGDEVTVDIDRGKTLIIPFVAVSDGHEDGTRTVFFVLNGQPSSRTPGCNPPRPRVDHRSNPKRCERVQRP